MSRALIRAYGPQHDDRVTQRAREKLANTCDHDLPAYDLLALASVSAMRLDPYLEVYDRLDEVSGRPRIYVRLSTHGRRKLIAQGVIRIRSDYEP